MNRIVVGLGIFLSFTASVPVAAAESGGDEECPQLGTSPWNFVPEARPECADGWRAQSEAAGAAGADLARYILIHEDCHEFPPRAVYILAPAPHPDCVASWAAWTAATGTLLAEIGAEYGAAVADYVVSNSGDSDGDSLPQLVEHDVCGRRLVNQVVTGALGVGSCNGYADYVAPA